MNCVIVNSEGLLYAGFVEGKPQWRRVKRDDMMMDDDMADRVVSQLSQLGFEDIKKRYANEITRKWVPKSLEADKVPSE